MNFYIPEILSTFAIKAVWLILLPLLFCFTASVAGIKWGFPKLLLFASGFLLAFITPLPQVVFSGCRALPAFVIAYLLVCLMINGLARSVADCPTRRRQMAVVTVIILLAAFLHHYLSSKVLVL